jgi:hypothetical protein
LSRDNLKRTENKYEAWKHWRAVWSRSNLLIGGSSTALGALVAANTKSAFLPNEYAITAAVLAPVLTFLLTALRPQANAIAFEAAHRELEKAIFRFNADPSKDDIFLADAVERGIDLLNKIGTS